MIRLLTRLTAVLAALALLAGCGTDMDPTAGSSGRTVVAVFDDALNLPKGAPVKAGGVPIGKVERITAKDYRARVVLRLDEGERLARGTTFRLRYTTALGELYVEATPPKRGPALADGEVVGPPEASTAPTVEDTLAQASLLVNGGNLKQAATIVDELNLALDGREGAVRGVLRGTDRLMVELIRSQREIDDILAALDGAARTLADRQDAVNRALREFRPAARVLRRNTDDLVRFLNSTDRLAVTADGLVRRTREDLLEVVRKLGPVLDTVLANRRTVLNALDVLIRFSGRINTAVPTDYLNLYLRLRVDTLLTDPSLPIPQLPGVPLPGGGLPSLPEVPQLPEIPGVTGPTEQPSQQPGGEALLPILPGLSGGER